MVGSAASAESTHPVPRVLITGIPAVGKSSITRELSRLIPGVSACEFARVMAAVGVERGSIRRYEDLVEMSQDKRAELQIATAERISHYDSPQAISAHLVVRGPEGYVDGLPPIGFRLLRPTGIVVVTCDSRQIYMRRAHHPHQQDSWNIREISLHQEIACDRAAELAQVYQLPIGYVLNSDGELRKAVEAAVFLWRSFQMANS